jgi:hypothetical protein
MEEADHGVVITAQHCRIRTAAQVQADRKATAKRVQQHRKGPGQGEQVEVTPLHDRSTVGVNGYGSGNSYTPSKAESLPCLGTVLGDDSFDLATAERGLGPPVKVGATRLVASVVGSKVNDATKTILRIEASQLMADGESEDDVAECLRIWLDDPNLRAHGLKLCMAEVYKRKHNGRQLTSTEQYAIRVAEIGEDLKRQQSRKELPQ